MFRQIFDEITSLTNTYICIEAAGSILFKDWSAKFYCDLTIDVNTIIDFGLSGGKLAGHTREAEVLKQIRLVSVLFNRNLSLLQD